jgi:putative addiction module killer protein/probable addiction module antidote protein
MSDIETTDCFDDWLGGLTDIEGKQAINVRIERARSGIFGDCQWDVDEGISQMRIGADPCYRVYFCRRGKEFLMLAGGTEMTQEGDIGQAAAIKLEIGGGATVAPLRRFNSLEYLGSREDMAAFIKAAKAEHDPAFFLQAASNVLQARGILRLSQETGIGYRMLCKMLSEGEAGHKPEMPPNALELVAMALANE